MKPEAWRKKHKENSNPKNAVKLPSVGTYDPLPNNLQTFERIRKETEGKKNTKAKST